MKRSFGQTLWRRRQLGTIKIVDKVETEDGVRPGVLHITLQVILKGHCLLQHVIFPANWFKTASGCNHDQPELHSARLCQASLCIIT